MLYKYLTRFTILIITIFISGCYYKTSVEPEESDDLGKKPVISTVANLCQFNVELAPGYDSPLIRDIHCDSTPVYKWTWRITKNNINCPDLNGLNLFFCDEVMENICAVYYKKGTNDWVYVEPTFEEDETLDGIICEDYADQQGIKLDVTLGDGEVLLVRIVLTEAFEMTNDATEALMRYSDCCCAGYIEGPSCPGEGQGEEDCCYTEESAWGANFEVGEHDFPGANWATYFTFNQYHSIPLYADQNVFIGWVSVSILNGFYELCFDTEDGWYILDYHIQVFNSTNFTNLKWIKNGNPIPGQFATKGSINSPEFEIVDGCMRLVDTEYNWLNNCVTTVQPITAGSYIALHVKAVNRICLE